MKLIVKKIEIENEILFFYIREHLKVLQRPCRYKLRSSTTQNANKTLHFKKKIY